MRKIGLIMIMALAICFSFQACSDDTNVEPGGTAVEDMAGTWVVTVDLVDASGNLLMADPYGMGHIHVTTYNTSANLPTEMWVTDYALASDPQGQFWDYKVKANVDYSAKSFSADTQNSVPDYNIGVKITNGKVLKGAAMSPSGHPVDSIVYDIQFEDDDPSYIYKISGFRYTGFPEDNI